jgi:uncharacterized protein YndB with AHSA1/START domain
MSCVVKEVVPYQKIVYSLQPKTVKIETLVTITLAKEGETTRLTRVHSGWDALRVIFVCRCVLLDWVW